MIFYFFFAAKHKEEYEARCASGTVWDKAKNKRVSKKPKGGYLSKAIREHYKDLAGLPSNDKDFKNAISYGKRCLKYYMEEKNVENDTPSKKRYRKVGAGQKYHAESVRARLFEWFIDVR